MIIKNNTFTLIFLLMIFTVFKVNANDINNFLNSQKPSNINSSKSSSLHNAIEYNKLLPTPVGNGGKYSQYGTSVSIDGNHAVIGAPGVLNHGAVYVLDFINGNWVESSVIIPNDVLEGENFGTAVSMSGDRILIGSDRFAYFFELDAVTNLWNQTEKIIGRDFSVSLEGNRAVIGAPYNRNSIGNITGSAYIYNLDLNNNMWILDTEISIVDGSDYDYFGYSVDLSGNRVIIGSYGDEKGSAYIYELDNITNDWLRSSKLTSNLSIVSRFGISVSIDNITALIGSTNGWSEGSAFIFVKNEGSQNWMEEAILTADAGFFDENFGNSVSLDGTRALIGTFSSDINVDGSAFVFELDSTNGLWEQSQRIVTNDGSRNDFFGHAISVSGDRIIVGAYGDDVYGVSSGSTYIFDLDNGVWTQNIKNTSGDSSTADSFGYAVSIYGNRALIGAVGDDTNGDRTGAAYIFDLDIESGQWLLSNKVFANDGSLGNYFGSSVSLYGDRALIGAVYDGAGSAYIFDLNNTTGLWEQSAKIRSNDGVWPDRFGHSVSLYGDKAIVGAYKDDDVQTNSGSAYVFELDNSSNIWIQSAKLNPDVLLESGYFGSSVELSKNRALIGGYDVDRDLFGIHTGRAYIFDFDTVSGLWSETTQLNTINAPLYNQFGVSMSLSGDRVVVGASQDTASGSAYVFDLNKTNGNWSQTAKISSDDPLNRFMGEDVELLGNTIFCRVEDSDPLNPADPIKSRVNVFNLNPSNGNWSLSNTIILMENELDDRFGYSISVDNDRVLIGAPYDDDHGSNSGSAFVFINSIFTNGFE